MIPIAKVTSEYATSKNLFLRKRVVADIFPSILLAEYIYKSDWGAHPLAKEPANNPLLLELDTDWDGKVIKHEGKYYKQFRELMDCAVTFSDDIVFSGKYEEIFLVREPQSQIRLFCINYPDFATHVVKLETVRDFYQLGDFDE
jgi:hypothetical protein